MSNPNRDQDGKYAPGRHSDSGVTVGAAGPPSAPQSTPGLGGQITDLGRQIRDLTDQQQRCVIRAIAEKVRQVHPSSARLWLEQVDGDYGRRFQPVWVADADGVALQDDFGYGRDRRADAEIADLAATLEADLGTYVDVGWDEQSEDYYLDVADGLAMDVRPRSQLDADADTAAPVRPIDSSPRMNPGDSQLRLLRRPRRGSEV